MCVYTHMCIYSVKNPEICFLAFQKKAEVFTQKAPCSYVGIQVVSSMQKHVKKCGFQG